MARPRNPVPAYRLHKQSGQAVVTVRDEHDNPKDMTLGKHGSPESLEKYQRLLAELQVGTMPVKPVAAGSVTIAELLLAYMKHAVEYYRTPDGTPTSEVKNLKDALRPVRELYATAPAREFGPLALRAVQKKLIANGLCRNVVNSRINRIRRAFKWAASHELIEFATYQKLTTVDGLAKGRSAARDTEEVQPIEDAIIEATLPHLPPMVRAMLEVQRLTGMRPSEVCNLKAAELDRGRAVWLFRPQEHKNAYADRERVIAIGPQAQAILQPFLDHGDEYVFCPRTGLRLIWEAKRAKRKSKVQPSQQCRMKTEGRVRQWSDRYRADTYASAIRWGVKKANRMRKPDDQLPIWAPNRVRHTFASEVRRDFGLEAAQVLLGHAKADTTQIYAERDLKKAIAVAAEVG